MVTSVAHIRTTKENSKVIKAKETSKDTTKVKEVFIGQKEKAITSKVKTSKAKDKADKASKVKGNVKLHRV